MKTIGVLLVLVLILGVSSVEGQKLTKPVILISDKWETTTTDYYMVVGLICSPKILIHPSFEVSSDSDSKSYTYNKVVSKGKCVELPKIPVYAIDPESIKMKLL